MVVVDGIAQKPLYSYVVTNGDKLVFDEAPESGSIIEVRILVGQLTTDLKATFPFLMLGFII